MGCPFLDAKTPEEAKAVLNNGIADWKFNDPSFASLKNDLKFVAHKPSPKTDDSKDTNI